MDARSREASARAEAAVVAESAATSSDGAIDVGASKASVDANLLHSDAESLPKVKIGGKIG
jgi:hypothetical protein